MKKVLVVDDSGLARKMVRRALESKDCEFVDAINGKNALVMVESEQPDLITLDMLMPEMDGLEFLHELRQFAPELPVIVVTADIQDEVRKECESLGAEFVNKPVREDEIQAAYERLLG